MQSDLGLPHLVTRKQYEHANMNALILFLTCEWVACLNVLELLIAGIDKRLSSEAVKG